MTNVMTMGMQPSDTEMLSFGTDNISDMYLTFAVGDEHYGVGISAVTEIVGLQQIMGIPDVPAFIKGVINLRGKVVPVMDVRLRFGMPERAYDERTVIIVMEVEGAPLGLIVDGVSEVLEISPDHIDTPSSFGSGRKSLVRGLGRFEDHQRVTILLDEQLLATDIEFTLPETAEE